LPWSIVVTINASDFRKDLFSILDSCIEEGSVYEVKRRRGTVKISASRRRVAIADLSRRPEALVDGDSLDSYSPAEWSAE
jgi:hypothetical protein